MNQHGTLSSWMSILAVGVLLVPAAVAVAGEAKKVRERSEIPTKDRWATENIFPNNDAWEKEFKAVEAEIPKLAALQGTMGKGPEELLGVLKFRDELEPRLVRIWVYASLRSDEDTRVPEYQAMLGRMRAMGTNYGQATSWMEPELKDIPFERVDSWMRENDELAVYRHFFDDLYRQQRHILSPREEELLALTGQTRGASRQAYRMLMNADMQLPTIKDEEGNEVELDDHSFYKHMRSTDRRVRKDAYEGIVGTYAKYANTTAAMYNGSVQSDLLTVKARDYESSLAASLDGSNIPVKVYDTLIKTVNKNLPLLHRYQEIRKRVLKLEDGVHAYDLFAPLVEDQKMDYTYEEAVETILDALKPLGKDYLTPMKKGFDSRWVDVYPNKGKRSGAYSSGTFLTQPYVLLNFHETYEDMSTLAHEMGHSMHSYFSRGSQPYVYADYDIFCAEVASTCNEIILQNYVLKRTKDPKKKLYLLVEFLEGIRGTVFRQTMFSEFEQRVHEMAEKDMPLTAETLNATYGEIMKRYYGPAYTHDDLVDTYWIRIPHFYRAFYVYKYSTSYCAASNIAARIMAGEPGAVEAYMRFLHAGSSKYPIDVLKLARVDMTTPEPVEDCMKLFKGLLDQTEELVAELGLDQ